MENGERTKNRGTLYTRLEVPHDHLAGSSTRVLLGGRNELLKGNGGGRGEVVPVVKGVEQV